MTQSNNAVGEWKNFWYLPMAAALGYATATLYVYSMGAFIDPIQQEFGWSRAQISSGITIAGFLTAFFGIPMGMLIDKVGPRPVALLGAIFMCGSLAMLGTATGTQSNWILLWSVLAFSTIFLHATVFTSAVTSRFEKSRGLALAITLSGASFAAAIAPVISTWLIQAYGWRTAYMGVGGGWFVIVFPVLFFCFRGAQDQVAKPGEAVVEPAKVLTGVSLHDGWRSPALYKLVAAAGLFAFTAVGTVVHFVPILTDSGAEPLKAAGIASLVGIFSIIGRLGTGVLLDRFPGHIVGGCAFLIPILACTLLLSDGSNPVYQALAAAIFGFTLGSEVDVIAFLAARYFGLKHFGALYGAMVMALAFGTAFGPLGAGMVFDAYGSYQFFLLATAVLMGLSAVMLFSLHATPTAEEHLASQSAGSTG